MNDLITTRQLAIKTGYTTKQICRMVLDGVIAPAKHGTCGERLYDPDVLPPKSELAPPVYICGQCSSWGDGRWCMAKERGAPYHRVACDEFGQTKNQEPETDLTGVDETMKPRRDITDTERDTALKAYRQRGSINQAAKESGLSWQKAYQVLTDAGVYKRESATASAEPVAEIVDEVVIVTESLDEPEKIDIDAHTIIRADLEEAQKALVVLDTIKQVYGEVPELELAVVDTYKRRRRVA